MSEKQLSRRDFLRSAAKVSAGAVVGAGLVSACQTKAQPTAIPATAAAGCGRDHAPAAPPPRKRSGTSTWLFPAPS